MARIADLSIGMSADSARLNKDLNKARKRTKKFSKGVSADFKRLAAGIGAALVIRGIVNFTQSLDDLVKTSRSVGVAAEEFQTLSYALSILGVNQATLSKSLIKVSQSLGEAGRGTKTYLDAINALGLSYSDLAGLSPDQAFVKITQALQDTTDANTRAYAGTLLLGRGYKELGSAVEAGAIGINKLRQEALDLNIVISEDTLRSAEDFNDSMARIGLQTKKLVAEGLGPIIDGFEGIVTSVSTFVAEYPKLARAITVTTIALIGLAVVAGIAALAVGAIGLVPALITAAVVAVAATLYIFREEVVGIIGDVVEFVYENMLNMGSIISKALENPIDTLIYIVKTGFLQLKQNIIDTLKFIADAAIKYLPESIIPDWVVDASKKLGELSDAIQKTQDELAKGIGLADIFEENAKKAEIFGDKIRDVFEELPLALEDVTVDVTESVEMITQELEKVLAVFDPNNINTGLLLEAIQEKLDARLAAIQQSLQNQQITEAEAYTQQLAAYKNFEDAKTKLKEEADQKRLDSSFAAGFFDVQIQEKFGELTNNQKGAQLRAGLQELAKHSRAAFNLNKAAAIAEAGINIAQGITKAIAQGGFLGLFTGAVVAIAGAVQIAAINSQTYGGPKQFGGRVQGGSTQLVGENGPELFSSDQGGEIIPLNSDDGGSPLGGSNTTINNFLLDTDDVLDAINEQAVNRSGLAITKTRTAGV